jgi:hypothetical protein
VRAGDKIYMQRENGSVRVFDAHSGLPVGRPLAIRGLTNIDRLALITATNAVSFPVLDGLAQAFNLSRNPTLSAAGLLGSTLLAIGANWSASKKVRATERGLAITPDQRYIVAGATDPLRQNRGLLSVIDTHTNKVRVLGDLGSDWRLSGGDTLVTFSKDNRGFQRVDLTTGKTIAEGYLFDQVVLGDQLRDLPQEFKAELRKSFDTVFPQPSAATQPARPDLSRDIVQVKLALAAVEQQVRKYEHPIERAQVALKVFAPQLLKSSFADRDPEKVYADYMALINRRPSEFAEALARLRRAVDWQDKENR